MSAVLVSSAVVAALAAAVRSTWSPCGWSMLSTITPLTERGRGHRFGVTAAWFVTGATVGGAFLGAASAALAVGVRLLDLGVTTRVAAGALLALLAATWDAALLRPALPHHRRQVNEDWLDEFRPWVYAAGFGLQIGSGLATYIMSAGVYLVIVLGALTTQPTTAWVVGVSFGLLRGLAVLLGHRNVDPARLAAFHHRFATLEAPARRGVVAVLATVGVTLGLAAAGAPPSIGVTLPLVAAVLTAAWVASTQRRATEIPATASLTTPTSVDRRAAEPTTA